MTSALLWGGMLKYGRKVMGYGDKLEILAKANIS
jgi:hypothetical protein